MRRQDELLALYPEADAPTRHYILAQVASLPIHFDSDELEDLLERTRREEEARLRAQTLATWHAAGPDLYLYAYGLDAERLGMWSVIAIATRPDPAAATGPLEGDVPDEALQRQSLAPLLTPCRDAVLEAARTTGPAPDLARELLGLVPLQGSEDVLMAGARNTGRALTSILALARHGRPLAAQALTTRRLLPLWLRALAAGAVGGREALDVGWEAVRHGDEIARWGAALALPAIATGRDAPPTPDGTWAPAPDTAQVTGPGAGLASEAVALATALTQVEQGWVRVLVADALAPLARALVPPGDPPPKPVLRLLDALLKEAGHDLVRIGAIRAMGHVPCDLSAKRAHKCLRLGSPILQAAAIESLVRQGDTSPALRDLLLERSRAGPVKLRATAVLGLMRLDREAALEGALALARSSSPTDRVAGAHCLGYLQCKTSLDILAVLARCDRFLPAALCATKSLCHFPEGEAAPSLIGLLDHPTADVALTALRVLSHFPGESQADVVSRLEVLSSRLEPGDLRILLRNAGRLGPAVSGVIDFLATPRTPRDALAGALEGLARAGSVPDPALAAAARSSSPPIQARVALSSLLGGDREAIDTLASVLDDPAGTHAALEALRELAVIAGQAGRQGRLQRFQALLAPPRSSRPAMERPRPAREPAMVPVRAKDSPDVLRRVAGHTRESLVAQVQDTVSADSVRGAPTARIPWVLELSYLQTQGLALLSGARRLAHPALLLAVAVVALISAGVAALGNGRGTDRLPVDPASLPRDLVVAGTVGSPRAGLRAGATPLIAGQRLEPGQTIRTGGGEKVALRARAGLHVLVLPSSDLRLVAGGGARREGRLALELAWGAVVIDAREGPPDLEVRLAAGPGEVWGSGLLVRADLTAGSLSVHVGSGRATVAARPGGSEVTLSALEVSEVGPTSGPAAPRRFDPSSVAWR